MKDSGFAMNSKAEGGRRKAEKHQHGFGQKNAYQSRKGETRD
jgi:hypothetical protein